MVKIDSYDHHEDASSSSNSTTVTADNNQNINLPPPSTYVLRRTHKESRYLIPTDLLFDGETLAAINLFQDYNEDLPKLWVSNVVVCGLPFNTLWVIRVVQLLCVNLITLILPFIAVVRESVYELETYDLLLVCGLHILLFVTEQFTLYEFPSTRRREQLYYVIFISLLYTIFESYFALTFALYFNQVITSITLLLLSAIFLFNHWYRRTKATEETLLQSSTFVTFNGVTRPETSDTRLNVGPQLVFPIPEEYAVPGDWR